MKFKMDRPEDINISNIQSVIENYESHIKELLSELNSFKEEHASLNNKFKRLVSENNRISEEYRNLLSSQNGFPDKFNHLESDILNNLRKQLEATVIEKESTTKLWQNAVQTIDNLEGELRIYQTGTQELVPKKLMNKLQYQYEERIHTLERKLASTKEKLHEFTTSASKELDKKTNEVEKTLENQAGVLKIIKNLEEEILSLQERLQNSIDAKIALEKKIKSKEKIIDNIKMQNAEYRTKVQEAVQVVEAALNEKDAALLREKAATGEVTKISKRIAQVISEAEDKVKNDVILIKNEYNEKLKDILNDLKSAQNEINQKSQEIEKYIKKCSELTNYIEQLQKGNLHIDSSNTSKLLVLEKNLESTFQKLLLSEKQNIQLTGQMECMKNDMDQMSNHYERLLKNKEIEKATVDTRLKQIHVQLDESNLKLCQVKEYCNNLKDNLDNLQKKYEEETKQKNLMQTTAKEGIELINKKHHENIKEFQAQLDAQISLNKKWRTETINITDNLEKLVGNLKSEIAKLKKDIRLYRKKLQDAESKINEYKVFLQLISKDVSKITDLTVGKQEPVR